MKDLLLDIFRNPLFPDIEASVIVKALAWLLAIASVGSVCGFLPIWMQTVYFGALALSFGYVILGGLRFNNRYIVLYIVLCINVLTLAIDPVFNSKMRLVLFAVVTMVVSSTIATEKAVIFRNLVFRYIIILCSILVPASCLCRFVGLNFVRMDTLGMTLSEQINTVGLFGGLFQHSMMLGPIAAVTAISFFFSYQSYGRKRIYIILFILSALACFFSASRGALLSMLAPIALAILFNKGDEDTKSSSRQIILIACLAILPLAENVISGVMEKQAKNEEMGSTFGSREDKFTYRWREFESSPLLGVGFAAIDPLSGDDYGLDGTIEPGSSHMAVLSMTGILGATCYVMIMLLAYSCVKDEDDTDARFKKALLIAMLLHGCWEGYVFSGGGFLCFLYWLVVGQCIDYKYLREYELLDEDLAE